MMLRAEQIEQTIAAIIRTEIDHATEWGKEPDKNAVAILNSICTLALRGLKANQSFNEGLEAAAKLMQKSAIQHERPKGKQSTWYKAFVWSDTAIRNLKRTET